MYSGEIFVQYPWDFMVLSLLLWDSECDGPVPVLPLARWDSREIVENWFIETRVPVHLIIITAEIKRGIPGHPIIKTSYPKTNEGKGTSSLALNSSCSVLQDTIPIPNTSKNATITNHFENITSNHL
jgi:hypothetical protein